MGYFLYFYYSYIQRYLSAPKLGHTLYSALGFVMSWIMFLQNLHVEPLISSTTEYDLIWKRVIVSIIS